jgi:NAD(P)-dependent dehydrogenase (short-subunit alcohol dehydrogenase family)
LEFRDTTTLITGAATGIGRSLAVALAREGSDLALLDIDEENGQQTAELVRHERRRAEFYRADVSERESLEQAIEAAWLAQGPIALVCANAGVGAIAPLLEMKPPDIEWLMRVNLFGVLDTVRAHVKHAREAKIGGHVLLTGSENSVGLPNAVRRLGFGIYGVTKHGVLHMADTLRYELEADGIGVSVLLPGPVQTEIQRSNRKRPDSLGGPATAPKVDASMRDPRFPMPPSITADAAARITIEGLRAGRFMIPTHSHLLDIARARTDELAAAVSASQFEPDM